MATYIIGDVHGYYDELITLLNNVKFNPGKDTLWLTGDLVSRGPNSLEVLRYLKSLGNNVSIVLGNHDLYLLSVYAGVNFNTVEDDYITSLLKAPDVDELLNWLRYQPLLQINEKKKLAMVHAGINPQWNLNELKTYAYDIERILKSNRYALFLKLIMNDYISKSLNKDFTKLVNLKFISNVFTRMRYCFPDGKLDFFYKDVTGNIPKYLKPWFNISSPITKEYSIVFGHWSSLKGIKTPKGIYSLDTGCCWGGELTCLHWEDKIYYTQRCFKRIN